MHVTFCCVFYVMSIIIAVSLDNILFRWEKNIRPYILLIP
jgi:hypothetical protein